MADHYRQQSDYDYNNQQSNYRSQHSSYNDQQADYGYTDQYPDNQDQQYNYNVQQTNYSRQSSNYNGQQQNNGGQKSNNRAFIIGIIAILVIGAVGIIIAVSVFGFDDNSSNSSNLSNEIISSHTVETNTYEEGTGTILADMYYKYCSTTGTWCVLGSDGSYLNIDTNPYDTENVVVQNAFNAIQNINNALGLPQSLYNDMCNTAAIDGRQSATFESIGVTVSWSYAPSKGLEVTYRLNYE